MTRIFAMTAGVTAALLAFGDTAAAARTYYGSIAISPTTRAYGYTSSATSKQAAIDGALDACFEHAEDCITAINFWGGACGAVAVGDRGGWGASWGEEIEFATQGAQDRCEENTYNCRVIRYQCSKR